MNIHFSQKIATFLICGSFMIAANTGAASNVDDYSIYCNESGGTVEEMPVEVKTKTGVIVKGQAKLFCSFTINEGLIAIGLETFSATEPSIAATFIKSMDEIKGDSNLWHGEYPNPSHNVCKNLGGSAISFVANGSFTSPLGESDICVFGDGSMVSAWSLIYMANHREGYETVKNRVKAEPFDIDLPN